MALAKTVSAQPHLGRSTILANALVSGLKEASSDMADVQPEDLILAMAMALAFLARQEEANKNDVMKLLRRCLDAPITWARKGGMPS